MALVQVRDYFLIPESVPLVKRLLDAGSLSCCSSRWTKTSSGCLGRCKSVCDRLYLSLTGQGREKFLVLSHPGTWLKVLRGQSGSLDQTFVISSHCFQTKQKKVVFFGFEDLLCFSKGGIEPQRTFFCFPPKTVLLAEDHLSCTQALKCIFSLSPASPFCRQRRLAARCPLLSPGHRVPGGGRCLPARDGDGAQRKTLPRCSFPGQRSQWDRPAALLLRPSIGVSPAIPPRVPRTKPSGSFSYQPQHLLWLSQS